MSETVCVKLEEVSRVCAQLGLSDWTLIKNGSVAVDEAKILQRTVGGEAQRVSLKDFQLGLEVELEHGRRFPEANVTNNHPIVTAKIVLAHLKESLDYYLRLDCMELETEVFDAMLAGDLDRAMKKRTALATLRQNLEARLLFRLQNAG